MALAKGYGVREAGKPEPVDADTVFQLASVSKSVGATVVASQVGAGKLAWDTPVTELLPWFALSDPQATALLTVGDLYAHRSGLPDHAGDELEDLGYDRREVLERLRLAAARRLPRPLRLHQLRADRRRRGGGDGGGHRLGDAVGDRRSTRRSAWRRTSSRFADYIARDNRAVPHMRTGGALGAAGAAPAGRADAGGRRVVERSPTWRSGC